MNQVRLATGLWHFRGRVVSERNDSRAASEHGEATKRNSSCSDNEGRYEEGQAMKSSRQVPSGPRSPWFGIGGFLTVLVLVVFFFLLAQSMVRHRFFRGGRVDQHDVIRQ